jgi:Uncharacterized protein conserved in bacteria
MTQGPSQDRADDLARILRASPGVMHVLTTLRDQGLDQWRLFSGAVYQTVWNHQTGREPGHGIRDYDIGYWDPDTSWDAEDVIIKRVAAAFDEPFRSTVEVRNQARVPLWFESHFGEPYAPLDHADQALERFVAPCFAVGVRLEDDDQISVAAPFGLDDVFDLVIRPNANRPVARDWDRVIAKAEARWPELKVVEP